MLHIYIYIYIYIYILYIYRRFSNGFLKIKRNEAQINLITKDKSSEIHIGEYIIKSSIAKNY